VSDFSKYLQRIAEEFATKKALADAIGMGQPRLSHALSGEDGYTFNVENCLRLAKIANRPASEVLRVAGKGDIAELLEHLYPRPGKRITGEQRDLLDDWALLDTDEQDAFRRLIRARAKEKRGRV
jgi:transcriptional regulator with XRE-family HTH domain